MIKEELLHQLKKLLSKLAGIGVAVLVPLALLLNGLAWSISPVYPYQAYDSLPPDAAGWSQEERLDLALLTLAYLQHPEAAETAVRFLERERLPGTQEPLYNERELAHLVDVKRLTDGIASWRTHVNLLLWVGLSGLLLWPRARPRAIWGLQRGMEFSGLLLGVFVTLVILFWPFFFAVFHLLLFPPGSWHFAGTDSLIRLFPEAFWVNYAHHLISGWFVAMALLLFSVLVINLFVRSVAREAKRELEEEAEQARVQVSSAAGPLPIEQFIHYSDLDAYGPPLEWDEDEEDNQPW